MKSLTSKLRNFDSLNFTLLILCSIIIHLFLLVLFQISSAGVDFGVVGQCCPLLERLIVSKEPSRTVTLPPNMAPIYTQLQELKVMVNCNYFYFTVLFIHWELPDLSLFQMTCTVSLECGAMFMTNGTKLRSIEVTRIRDLSDDILASWLRRNSLQFLEVVII